MKFFYIKDKNAAFGQYSFINEKPRSSGARSINISSLIYCEKSEFLSILKDFKQDYVIFIFIFKIYTLAKYLHFYAIFIFKRFTLKF